MTKYKITAKTKVHFGITLHQIQATVSFGAVVKGEIGGWIETEKNLTQDGNAWVSGNAQVFGGAQVSGDAQVFGNAWVSGDAQVTPLYVQGLMWPVTITDKHIRIGCEFHPISEWEKFDSRRILEMGGKTALKFWQTYKNFILGIAKTEERG